MTDYAFDKKLYNEINAAREHISAINFIKESNKIEGINRELLQEEIAEFNRFMGLEKVQVSDLQKFVEVYQPGAVLRDKDGLDVGVGGYSPPVGSKYIKDALANLLEDAEKSITASAYKIHNEFETLHPFMDCNGRAGRMLWMWQMGYAPLGFLHTFYYQALNNYSGRK